jgi:hypothetical protein
MARANNAKAGAKIVVTPQFVGSATPEEIRRFYLER